MAARKQTSPTPSASPGSVELIWSYWMEESMMVQGLDAVLRRFQSEKPSGNDPLAHLDTAPLRPLSNLLWGYIQDNQHRLSVRRRAYEYDHHYGISLKGQSKSKRKQSDFQRAFHALLSHSMAFLKNANDAGKSGKGKLLDSIRAVQQILARRSAGSDQKRLKQMNREMRARRDLLARPEMQTFLGIQPPAGTYQKRWMSAVDTLKTLLGGDSTRSIHYNDLALSGAKLLAGIRNGHWDDAASAARWAAASKNTLKKYINAYQIVNGTTL